jgi:hypothetical protein
MQFAESIEELEQNPNKFGAPTFEQFRANKERYMGRYDDVVASIDSGDKLLGCRQKYYVENYRVESLEHAERLCADMGASIHDSNAWALDPQVVPDSSVTGYHLEVNFRLKKNLEKRANW